MAPITPTPVVPEAPGAPISSSSSTTTPTPATTASKTGEPAFPQIVENDPQRTGFDPRTAWWVNYFKILTGSINGEGQFHYREARARANEAALCRQCEGWRDWAFRYSPTVRFLRERVGELGGRLDASNVSCGRCPARLTDDGAVHRQSGGFSPDAGILLCADVLRDRKHLEDSLAHEMVHAWDHLRWKDVDFRGEKDLRHAACTEIRASMLSGECRWTREAFTRGNWTLTQQFQDCVRKRAVQSVMARPMCKDDVQAVKVVNQVWDSCFSDTRPFDEVYR